MDPSKTMIGMSKEERDKLEKKERSMIQICLVYFILLNVSKAWNCKKTMR